MKFVCERCHTKYSIADEKVRGKVLKVRCKTCTNVITVRETGATIDDAGGAVRRESAVSRSGSFDAGAPTVANASVVAKAAARSARPAALPAEALFAPAAPVAAPPPRRPTPAPPPPADDVEWYLAVDGAQTGPFTRARLVDKILAQPKEADVHVWNAGFDGWKAPKDVAELDAEMRRRRGAPAVPPPPARRPTGGVPALLGADAPDSGAIDAALAALDSGGHPGGKAGGKNGLAAAGLAPAAEAPSKFGLGDLLGDAETGGLTPPPAANGAAAIPGSLAAGVAAATGPLPSVAPAVPGKGKPVKLLLGAAGVVAVLCGIVLFWMFRKPTTSVAASPPPAKAPATDFAGLAEKLAKEEAEKAPAPPPPVEAPAVEAKPSVTKVEAPARTTKGKGKHKAVATAPPPLSPTSPAALTAEQRDAANRFGQSTGREVRVPTGSASGGARSTPAQADISRVINNNRQGIQTCYQRALLRDNSLTHGKVTVRVSIGLSGKVKSVNLDAPAQFRALEPCIRDVMSRWAFPPSSEEYGTEFPVVLQGNN